MTERHDAIKLANAILDKPHIDPDGDVCTLARQFLREIERANILRAQVELLREAHDLANQALRTAYSVAEREGRETNWSGHRRQLTTSLETSHAAINALNSIPKYEPPIRGTSK